MATLQTLLPQERVERTCESIFDMPTASDPNHPDVLDVFDPELDHLRLMAVEYAEYFTSTFLYDRNEEVPVVYLNGSNITPFFEFPQHAISERRNAGENVMRTLGTVQYGDTNLIRGYIADAIRFDYIGTNLQEIGHTDLEVVSLGYDSYDSVTLQSVRTMPSGAMLANADSCVEGKMTLQVGITSGQWDTFKDEQLITGMLLMCKAIIDGRIRSLVKERNPKDLRLAEMFFKNSRHFKRRRR